ncbi:hypothetical protein PILCRDRAFT_829775 [Piloderma croceum F 1598]|uniref:Uncharacterized protein n=1 Tax=Piloderma croceum (strain F 1598) TaxID=765440 RepID=A0A0C3AF02_PILCF|nr:hypothetical protein PILCRDRAFT_829775 [Piloderma croceum F 1598]
MTIKKECKSRRVGSGTATESRYTSSVDTKKTCKDDDSYRICVNYNNVLARDDR